MSADLLFKQVMAEAKEEISGVALVHKWEKAKTLVLVQDQMEDMPADL